MIIRAEKFQITGLFEKLSNNLNKKKQKDTRIQYEFCFVSARHNIRICELINDIPQSLYNHYNQTGKKLKK